MEQQKEVPMLPQFPNTILHPGEFHASQRQQKQSNRT